MPIIVNGISQLKSISTIRSVSPTSNSVDIPIKVLAKQDQLPRKLVRDKSMIVPLKNWRATIVLKPPSTVGSQR